MTVFAMPRANDVNLFVQWLQPHLTHLLSMSVSKIHVNLTKIGVKNVESSARACDRATNSCCDRFTLKLEYRPIAHLRLVKIHFCFRHNQPDRPPEVDMSGFLLTPDVDDITTDELQTRHPWNSNDASSLTKWVQLTIDCYERQLLEYCVIKPSNRMKDTLPLTIYLDKHGKEQRHQTNAAPQHNKIAPRPVRLAYGHRLLKVNVQKQQLFNVMIVIQMKLDAMLALPQYNSKSKTAGQPDVLVTAELKNFGYNGADVNVHMSPYLTMLLSDDTSHYLPKAVSTSDQPFELELFVKEIHSGLTAEIDRITQHQMQKARIMGAIVNLFEKTRGLGEIRSYDEHLLTYCEAQINVNGHAEQKFLLRIELGARGFPDGHTVSLQAMNGEVQPVYKYGVNLKLNIMHEQMEAVVSSLVSKYDAKVYEMNRKKTDEMNEGCDINGLSNK